MPAVLCKMADFEKTKNIHIMIQYNIWFNTYVSTIVDKAMLWICILGVYYVILYTYIPEPHPGMRKRLLVISELHHRALG